MVKDQKQSAHVELFSGCLRVFAPGKSYGEEYVFSCSLHWVSCDEVEIKGISNPAVSPVNYRRAICNALTEHGVKILRWSRKSSKGDQLIRINTETGKFYRE